MPDEEKIRKKLVLKAEQHKKRTKQILNSEIVAIRENTNEDYDSEVEDVPL